MIELYVSLELKNGIEVSVADILVKILKTVEFKTMVSSVNIVLSRQLFRLKCKLKRLFIKRNSAVRPNICLWCIKPKIRLTRCRKTAIKGHKVMTRYAHVSASVFINRQTINYLSRHCCLAFPGKTVNFISFLDIVAYAFVHFCGATLS